ncbi:hypothetical protein Hanom_Chr15g01380511 [Helianthus anomalus]
MGPVLCIQNALAPFPYNCYTKYMYKQVFNHNHTHHVCGPKYALIMFNKYTL